MDDNQLEEIFRTLKTEVRQLTFEQEPHRESRGISMWIAAEVPKGRRIELNRNELRAWAEWMYDYAEHLDAVDPQSE